MNKYALIALLTISFILLAITTLYAIIMRFFEIGFDPLISDLPVIVPKRLNETKSRIIPRIIYICNKNIKDIPKNVIAKWKDLNPDYSIELFGDKECADFIETHFGKTPRLNFEKIPDGPIKADYWRTCILYVRGGIYVDVDIVPLKSIDSIIKEETFSSPTLIIPGSGVFWKTVNPCFIAVTPRNPIFEDCLYLYDYLFTYKTYFYWQFSIVVVLTRVLNAYFPVRNVSKTYLSSNHQIKILKEIYTNVGGIPSLCTSETCSNDYIVNEKNEKLLKTRADNYDRFKHQFVSLLKNK